MLRTEVLAGDPVAAADAADLTHGSDDGPGIARVRRGRGFRYVDAGGRAVRDPATLARIRALAIPPAWTRVWIAAAPDRHLQATGRDARGRKQYRYHARWKGVRDEVKYHRLVAFCGALPRLRAAVERDLACPCLCKRKVIATVVALMERAQLRVGNDEYARDNGSYGATTLRDRHARIAGDTLELAYRAKGGVARRVRVTDRRLARIVRRCRDLPGQRLFQYVEGDAIKAVTSTDVNAYVRAHAGGAFTAKDYRTWAATLGAAMLLCAIEHPGTVRGCTQRIGEVLAAVAGRLGHTVAVCRGSYVHPRILEDFRTGALARALARPIRRRLGGAVAIHGDAIDVRALRAIEPVVARYLDAQRRRGHA